MTGVCVCVKTESSNCSCDYGRSYSYRVYRAPLCDYMVSFIHKLRNLPESYMMNSVLENFTVLQVTHECCAVGASPNHKPIRNSSFLGDRT